MNGYRGIPNISPIIWLIVLGPAILQLLLKLYAIFFGEFQRSKLWVTLEDYVGKRECRKILKESRDKRGTK